MRALAVSSFASAARRRSRPRGSGPRPASPPPIFWPCCSTKSGIHISSRTSPALTRSPMLSRYLLDVPGDPRIDRRRLRRPGSSPAGPPSSAGRAARAGRSGCRRSSPARRRRPCGPPARSGRSRRRSGGPERRGRPGDRGRLRLRTGEKPWRRLRSSAIGACPPGGGGSGRGQAPIADDRASRAATHLLSSWRRHRVWPPVAGRAGLRSQADPRPVVAAVGAGGGGWGRSAGSPGRRGRARGTGSTPRPSGA